MTDKIENKQRQNAMEFNQQDFVRLVINDLNTSKAGSRFLRSYTQSQVRDAIEGYQNEKYQNELVKISKILWAKSPQYQRLIKYFSGMSLFSHVITPIQDISKIGKNKVSKQFLEIAELLKMMSLKHEMSQVLEVVMREDVFYGYVVRDKKGFTIQRIPSHMCKISSKEDGIFNYSINMSMFTGDDEFLEGFPTEIILKYKQWLKAKDLNPKTFPWVELDAKNTICIKYNETFREVFPPFAGTFDSIFDIEAFKELRKDKETLGNYMILTQKVPIRTSTDANNDFAIDQQFMNYFHNQASTSVPDNVGVITSPMEIDAVKFDKDRADTDGVGKATRDFWEGSGASQLLFSSGSNSSSSLGMSIKTDEEIVFTLMTQIERWVNRYLKNNFAILYFNARILPITIYNQQDMYKMYLESATYGAPTKSFLSASVGLDPIEFMGMAYLENEILLMHEEWIPLQSSHTMSSDDVLNEGGRPQQDDDKIADETEKTRDKQ